MKNKSLRNGPDSKGYYGEFGGMYSGITLIPPLVELEKAFNEAIKDQSFLDEFDYYLKHFVGRPSPLYFAEGLTKKMGGAKILFKQEHLNHTGSHKITNALFQVLLAKRMGKKRLLCESGAGAHFSAVAACAAKFQIPLIGIMGDVDVKRVNQNIVKAKHYGAKLITTPGTLKDAITTTLKTWTADPDSYYVCGSSVASSPFPRIVQYAQSIIGRETREQIINMEGRLMDLCVGCVGGGSNFIGLIHEFLDEPNIKMIGVEASESAALTKGTIGIMQGMKSYMLQNEYGSITMGGPNISAGTQFYSVGPEHSYLKSIGRVEYRSCTDREMLDAYKMCAKYEGIIPALEPMAGLYHALKEAKEKPKDYIIVSGICGRGEKDLDQIESLIGKEFE